MLVNFICENCSCVFADTERHHRRYCSIKCRYSDPAEIERMRIRRAGIKHTEESRKKMSISRAGSKRSEATKQKMSKTWKGRPRPWQIGEKNWAWKGGITPEHIKIRNSIEGREWSRMVLKRDNYTCKKCGKRGGDLNADHIKPFALFPELRFDLNNGQALCIPCHKEKTYAKTFSR